MFTTNGEFVLLPSSVMLWVEQIDNGDSESYWVGSATREGPNGFELDVDSLCCAEAICWDAFIVQWVNRKNVPKMKFWVFCIIFWMLCIFSLSQQQQLYTIPQTISCLLCPQRHWSWNGGARSIVADGKGNRALKVSVSPGCALHLNRFVGYPLASKSNQLHLTFSMSYFPDRDHNPNPIV